MNLRLKTSSKVQTGIDVLIGHCDALVGDVTVVSVAWCRFVGMVTGVVGHAGPRPDPNFSCAACAEAPGVARGRRIRSVTTPRR